MAIDKQNPALSISQYQKAKKKKTTKRRCTKHKLLAAHYLTCTYLHLHGVLVRVDRTIVHKILYCIVRIEYLAFVFFVFFYVILVVQLFVGLHNEHKECLFVYLEGRKVVDVFVFVLSVGFSC